MNAKKLLSLWGLKWNPFSPELPSEGLLVTAKIEHFSGDGRLLELLRHEDLIPLGTRIRTRLKMEPASRDELLELLSHALAKAGTPSLMTSELMNTLVDHAAGNYRLLMAEDALPVVRERVEGMARHRGLDFAAIEIHVITVPTLRLDRGPHRERLLETAKRVRPRLLLLDPLVRLHAVDENHATEVAGLLAYFRSLQRRLDLSVVLVHHSRKNAPSGVAAGQGLRGSSDLHAFGDSNLYLRRTKQHLVLSSEHRAAPASPPVYLQLVTSDAQTTHLELVTEADDGNQPGLQDRVLDLLARGGVLTRGKLRDALSVKNERLGEALQSLEQANRLRRTSTGWARVD